MAAGSAPKLIFLSHITEEKKLAGLIKEAIEREFSGFVDVFVSSDGISIPAGSNFLKRIENGLIECIGAIYLISPVSVVRSWINFELGAVWIRSAISERGGGNEIPALPFCHSGMLLRSLPPPIGSLNAIEANQASQLRFAFSSLQRAVGGKGTLNTNFDELASNIVEFEQDYTIGNKITQVMFSIMDKPEAVIVIEKAEKMHSGTKMILSCKDLEADVFSNICIILNDVPQEFYDTEVHSSSSTFDDKRGMVNTVDVDIKIDRDLLVNHKKSILS